MARRHAYGADVLSAAHAGYASGRPWHSGHTAAALRLDITGPAELQCRRDRGGGSAPRLATHCHSSWGVTSKAMLRRLPVSAGTVPCHMYDGNSTRLPASAGMVRSTVAPGVA